MKPKCTWVLLKVVFWTCHISVYLMLYKTYDYNSCLYGFGGRNQFWQWRIFFDYCLSFCKICGVFFPERLTLFTLERVLRNSKTVIQLVIFLLNVLCLPIHWILLQAYRKLAKEYHPDKNPDAGDKVCQQQVENSTNSSSSVAQQLVPNSDVSFTFHDPAIHPFKE